MIKILLPLILMPLLSCVSGDKLDSKLKYLNGDSYQSKKTVLMVPVVRTKDQENIKKKRKENEKTDNL